MAVNIYGNQATVAMGTTSTAVLTVKVQQGGRIRAARFSVFAPNGSGGMDLKGQSVNGNIILPGERGAERLPADNQVPVGTLEGGLVGRVIRQGNVTVNVTNGSGTYENTVALVLEVEPEDAADELAVRRKVAELRSPCRGACGGACGG